MTLFWHVLLVQALLRTSWINPLTGRVCLTDWTPQLLKTVVPSSKGRSQLHRCIFGYHHTAGLPTCHLWIWNDLESLLTFRAAKPHEPVAAGKSVPRGVHQAEYDDSAQDVRWSINSLGLRDGYLYLNYLTSFFPEHHVSSCHPPKKLAWWSGCTVHRGSPIAPIGCQACEWISVSRRVAWQERSGSQAPKLYRQCSSFHLAKDSLFTFGEIKNGGAKIIELQIAIEQSWQGAEPVKEHVDWALLLTFMPWFCLLVAGCPQQSSDWVTVPCSWLYVHQLVGSKNMLFNKQCHESREAIEICIHYDTWHVFTGKPVCEAMMNRFLPAVPGSLRNLHRRGSVFRRRKESNGFAWRFPGNDMLFSLSS